MIYIINANEMINILTITAVCREYSDLLLTIIHRRVSQNSQDPLSAREGVKFRQLVFRKIM